MLTINLNKIFITIVTFLSSNPLISFILLVIFSVPCILLFMKLLYMLNKFWLNTIFKKRFIKDEEGLIAIAFAVTLGFTIFFSFKMISILTYAHIL